MADLVTPGATAFWQGRRVFLTGHTGFKGSWASIWLASLGAKVFGYALEPPTAPSLFEEADVQSLLSGHSIGDIRDAERLSAALRSAVPDVVIHMAAQPLVRQSYADPVETYATNVMGTVNVLEAVRRSGDVSTLVNVTTDKCYENKEWLWGYRESEPLGGHDPYSSSKACAELVTAAYRSSFHQQGRPWIASARAGNVIGGGDWAVDRLVPDAMRSLGSNSELVIRHPQATRPWQHVLEPVAGYLTLAERLATDPSLAGPWNFGPSEADARPVSWILSRIQALRPELKWRAELAQGVHEAGLLKLDSSKAGAMLGWTARWRLDRALELTVDWHSRWSAGEAALDLCREQIAIYGETIVDG